MNERTKTGLDILKVAVITGILGDVLLRVKPWGLNVLLFNVAFAVGVYVLLRRRAPQFLTGETTALLGALVFFASMFAWRDSIQLRVADTFAIIAILSVLIVPRMKIPVRLAGIFHYVAAFFWSSFNALFMAAALLFVDIEWKLTRRFAIPKGVIAALKGLAIVAPLLLIFGALFVSADAVYEGWVNRIFNINIDLDFTHVALFAVFAWLSAGYLRGVMLQNPIAGEEPITKDGTSGASRVDQVRSEVVENPVALHNNLSILEHINLSDPPASPAPFSKPEKKPWDWAKIDHTSIPTPLELGGVEIGVILGLTNLLFLSFVIVQVPYLFGGMELVQSTPDFKLAEYARRGFGELVAVSALVLPMLLLGHWLIREGASRVHTLFRILACIQIALLFVIMASAMQRLVLLTGNLGYGLTTVRLYPMIFMTWLAVVFVWFGFTVLRGARRHFAWGALWSAFFILGTTHFVNPDEFIVKTNVALMQQGRPFDATYNARLSDDAIPALLEAFPAMNMTDQCTVRAWLTRRLDAAAAESDLRSWNFGRSKAAKAMRGASLDMANCSDIVIDAVPTEDL
ncbi:MAG: DUF4153 domain-containing protein [Pyrinomonadaceae bacterium]